MCSAGSDARSQRHTHTLWGRGGKLRAGCGTEKGFEWLNQPPLLGPLAPDSKNNADKGLFFASISSVAVELNVTGCRL